MCLLFHVPSALCRDLQNLNNPEHADTYYNFKTTNEGIQL